MTTEEKMREALQELVNLKDYKDTIGKDGLYEAKKDAAWHCARAALSAAPPPSEPEAFAKARSEMLEGWNESSERSAVVERKHSYILCEPYLSGYRVIVGFEDLKPAQDFQAAIAAMQPCATVLLDPDMSDQELRLHMGEMTAQEMRTARAAIRWANTKQPCAGIGEDEIISKVADELGVPDWKIEQKKSLSHRLDKVVRAMYIVGILPVLKPLPVMPSED